MGESEARGAIAYRGSRVRLLLIAGFVGLALGAVGAFAGIWGWHAFSQWSAERAAAAAASAAEAERASPKGRQQEVMLRYLFDPASAQFRNVRQSRGEQTAWCGEVNARNRMGGMVGFRRYVVVLYSINDRAANPLDRVDVDPDEPSGSAKQAAFDQRHAAFCY